MPVHPLRNYSNDTTKTRGTRMGTHHHSSKTNTNSFLEVACRNGISPEPRLHSALHYWGISHPQLSGFCITYSPISKYSPIVDGKYGPPYTSATMEASPLIQVQRTNHVRSLHPQSRRPCALTLWARQSPKSCRTASLVITTSSKKGV